jgi:hypothetical protein
MIKPTAPLAPLAPTRAAPALPAGAAPRSTEKKPAGDLTATPPPAEGGPLACLPANAAVDPALIPSARVFFTADGRALADQIDRLKTYPELASAADLHGRIAAAADTLAARPGWGVLLVSGCHHAPSSLMQIHAAVDICKKHGWPLLLESEQETFEWLHALVRFLQAEPNLKLLLGKHKLHSRAGQQIAWNYVRQSGDRGALQQFLPEVLGSIDIRHSGVRRVHVDKVGAGKGSDEGREASMVRNTHRALSKEGKGVLLLGLVHSMPLHESFRQFEMKCSEVAVLDESANHAYRLFDKAERDNPTYHTAVVHSNRLRLPEFRRAADQTETFRMPADLSPFC